MRKVGFWSLVVDEASLCQVLCTSSLHMTQLRDGSENPEAIVLSTQAIQSVNRRLAESVLVFDEKIITAIIAFSCHAVSNRKATFSARL